jgi:hypothetical protein
MWHPLGPTRDPCQAAHSLRKFRGPQRFVCNGRGPCWPVWDKRSPQCQRRRGHLGNGQKNCWSRQAPGRAARPHSLAMCRASAVSFDVDTIKLRRAHLFPRHLLHVPPTLAEMLFTQGARPFHLIRNVLHTIYYGRISTGQTALAMPGSPGTRAALLPACGLRAFMLHVWRGGTAVKRFGAARGSQKTIVTSPGAIAATTGALGATKVWPPGGRGGAA